MDRLDYVSMMANEHAYLPGHREDAGHRGAAAGAVHPVMFDEITRILNHLLWRAATAWTSVR